MDTDVQDWKHSLIELNQTFATLIARLQPGSVVVEDVAITLESQVSRLASELQSMTDRFYEAQASLNALSAEVSSFPLSSSFPLFNVISMSLLTISVSLFRSKSDTFRRPLTLQNASAMVLLSALGLLRLSLRFAAHALFSRQGFPAAYVCFGTAHCR
jgi:hypothetical protein